MQKVRAKFTCTSISEDKECQTKTVKLITQYSDNPEDNQFSDATPYLYII